MSWDAGREANKVQKLIESLDHIKAGVKTLEGSSLLKTQPLRKASLGPEG